MYKNTSKRTKSDRYDLTMISTRKMSEHSIRRVSPRLVQVFASAVGAMVVLDAKLTHGHLRVICNARLHLLCIEHAPRSRSNALQLLVSSIDLHHFLRNNMDYLEW